MILANKYKRKWIGTHVLLHIQLVRQNIYSIYSVPNTCILSKWIGTHLFQFIGKKEIIDNRRKEILVVETQNRVATTNIDEIVDEFLLAFRDTIKAWDTIHSLSKLGIP